jgi:pyruvate/2-oxoglutarate dehydrogenase complex dihydrolipoamide acyltransferase (E2) component
MLVTLAKVDVTVNAPVSGMIVELLAQEEDTVSVGQELFRIEAGEAGMYMYHSSIPQLMSDLIRLAAAPQGREGTRGTHSCGFSIAGRGSLAERTTRTTPGSLTKEHSGGPQRTQGGQTGIKT